MENAFDNAYIKPTVEVSLLLCLNFKLLYIYISQNLEASIQKAQQTIMNDSGHGTVWNYIFSLFLLFSFRSWKCGEMNMLFINFLIILDSMMGDMQLGTPFSLLNFCTRNFRKR